ncbi:proteophosphoglycan ppg4 [Rhodotorula toruloides]|uniref:Proteophosphoglycan ppg4 n=1 Tax=Rhodotorula toruloides TaxID=5286 RepID=A0A511KIN7_RHOTO|nr:proteophosphoglycan ppg4 [Rhodotorula toruloides]
MPDKFAVASKPPGKVAGFFRQIKSRKSLRKLKDTSVKDENDRKHVPPLPSALPPKLELLDLPIFSGDFRSLSQSLDSNASSGSQHRSPAGGLVSTDEADGGLASLLQLTSFAEGAHLYDRDLYSSTESTASTAPACSFDRQSSSVGEDDAVDEYGSASSVGHDSAPTSPKMMTVSFLSFPLTVPRSGFTLATSFLP